MLKLYELIAHYSHLIGLFLKYEQVIGQHSHILSGLHHQRASMTRKSLEAAWVRSTNDFAHWIVLLCFHWLL